MYIVTDVAHMNLLNYMNEYYNKLSELQIRHIFFQIATAVQYCHQNNIMHRDLKPENILVSVDSQGIIYDLKLADFGKACHFNSTSKFHDVPGTPLYCAPEMLVCNGTYTHSADIFALGIILHNLVSGEIPFGCENWEEIRENLLY